MSNVHKNVGVCYIRQNMVHIVMRFKGHKMTSVAQCGRWKLEWKLRNRWWLERLASCNSKGELLPPAVRRGRPLLLCWRRLVFAAEGVGEASASYLA